MRRILVVALVALSTFFGLGFSWSESRWSGQTMGTTYSIHIFMPGYLQESARSSTVDLTNIANSVEQRLSVINASMSTYISDSEISKLNHTAMNLDQCYQVSQEFFEVLQIAQEIHQQVPLFDITLGPLIDLWGFGSESDIDLQWRPPSQKEIDQVLTRVGLSQLKTVQPNCVYKQADVALDVSSIAKGYAVDDIAREFRSKGLDNFLIEIGGEVYASGYKPGLRPWLSDQPWSIGIESPVNVSFDQQLSQTKPIALHNVAIATSGDYRNYFEYDGKYYSHILSPETGRPVHFKATAAQRLTSVSVVHESTAWADGLATALFVLGYEHAQEFALSHKLKVALMSVDQSKETQVWVSPDLQSANQSKEE